MKFSPSQQDLADILPHIRYEIEQTFVVPKHDQTDWHVGNQCISLCLFMGDCSSIFSRTGPGGGEMWFVGTLAFLRPMFQGLLATTGTA